MNREHRKHPRVPIRQACSLRGADSEHSIHAMTSSVANRGLGLHLIEPDNTRSYCPGEQVSVLMALENGSTELQGTIAWSEPAADQSLDLGILLVDVPSAYLQLVQEQYASLREQSLEMGGALALQRKITLRTLQQALDDQARDGGPLREHLERLAQS